MEMKAPYHLLVKELLNNAGIVYDSYHRKLLFHTVYFVIILNVQ